MADFFPAAAQDGDLGWPLQRSARLYEQALAVVDGGRSVTYGQLARRVAGLAAALDAFGVNPGARAGFLGVNSLAHVESWLGMPAAGRVLVDLNFRLAEAELAFIAEDCGLELLVVDWERLEVGRALRRRCPSLRELVLDDPRPCPEDCIPYEQLVSGQPTAHQPVTEWPLATISYTGGTTGTPKGVMLSHANLLANARHNLIATGHSDRDRWLHVAPMFHVAGVANLFACTWVGARQIVLPRFDPRAVAETIDREQISHVVLVPTMLQVLLEHLEREPGYSLSSLRHIQYAASPISPELQRRVLEQFDCDVAQFYGMTEAAPTVTCCPPETHRRGAAGEEPHHHRLRSIGVPVVGVQAEVRAPDGGRLPPGEVGEIWVRGPNVMLGYWNRPDATDAALAGGWYRTGDAAYADADSWLYVVDRLKDMIITGGENVYSIEVEAALLDHDAVSEAAVIGVPDQRWGEAVHAVVCVKQGAAVSAEDLIAHCRRRIAGYKVPRSVEFRPAPLPKSGAGKLLKHLLREPVEPGAGPG